VPLAQRRVRCQLRARHARCEMCFSRPEFMTASGEFWSLTMQSVHPRRRRRRRRRKRRRRWWWWWCATVSGATQLHQDCGLLQALLRVPPHSALSSPPGNIRLHTLLTRFSCLDLTVSQSMSKGVIRLMNSLAGVDTRWSFPTASRATTSTPTFRRGIWPRPTCLPSELAPPPVRSKSCAATTRCAQ
jgi:hypothetical protein